MHVFRPISANFDDTKILVLEQKADTGLALCRDLVSRLDKQDVVVQGLQFYGNLSRRMIWFFYVYVTMSMVSMVVVTTIFIVLMARR